MISADLSLASQIESAIQLRRPVEPVAVGEAILIERAERKVERSQVVGRVDAAGQHRTGHCNQQSGGGKQRPAKAVAAGWPGLDRREAPVWRLRGFPSVQPRPP